MNNLRHETDRFGNVSSDASDNRSDSALKNNNALLDSLRSGYSSKTSQLNSRLNKQIAVNGMLSLAVVALTAATLYLAVFRTTDPYVLEVDENNNVSYGGPLTSTLQMGDEYTAPELGEFIEYWRTVTPDNTMQKRNITRLYCMIPKGSVTETKMNGYFTNDQNDPFVKNKNLSVATRIRQISKLDGSTWQVEWYETSRSHDGTVIAENSLVKGTMIVEKTKPDPNCREGNPLGVYIMDINWTNIR